MKVLRITLLGLLLGLPSLVFGQLYYFSINADGSQEVPARATPATGSGFGTLYVPTLTLTLDFSFTGLLAPETAAHLHTGAPGVAGPVVVPLALGDIHGFTTNVTSSFANSLIAGNTYLNVHSTLYPGGEIRGQLAVTGVAVPEPSTYAWSGVVALAALIGVRRWCQGRRCALAA